MPCIGWRGNSLRSFLNQVHSVHHGLEKGCTDSEVTSAADRMRLEPSPKKTASAPMPALPLSPLPGLAVVDLLPRGEAPLQRFFDAIPACFLAVHGEPARPDEALQELQALPPAVLSASGRASGQQTDTVCVMAKPLLGQTLSEYHALVPRDRPAARQCTGAGDAA